MQRYLKSKMKDPGNFKENDRIEFCGRFSQDPKAPLGELAHAKVCIFKSLVCFKITVKLLVCYLPFLSMCILVDDLSLWESIRKTSSRKLIIQQNYLYLTERSEFHFRIGSAKDHPVCNRSTQKPVALQLNGLPTAGTPIASLQTLLRHNHRRQSRKEL